MSFTVAIAGRPNVGKSTLFNRLLGKPFALVDDTPGVTRDWREGEGHIGPMEFRVIDTPGLEKTAKGTLASRMNEQTLRAVREADVVLLIVDGREGITEEDRYFVSVLRKTGKPLRLVVNKAEGGKSGVVIAEAFSLGLGEPVAISSAHGEGMVDLYEALAPYADPDEGDEAEEGGEEDTAAPILHMAIVGRPNVGKSTLLNQLLGEERVLTGPEAGITRDSIAVDYSYKGRSIKLVDTAGLRRRSNVTEKIEKMAGADTRRTIQYAQVVVLVVDGTVALEKQDNTIASWVEEEGRALVIAVNKWDKVEDKAGVLKEIRARLKDELSQVAGVPVVPISALEGKDITRIFDAAFDVYEQWNRRVSTGELNRFLAVALERHTPPIVGAKRIKIRYITQVKSRPPSFVLFVNDSKDFPDSYLRYLKGGLREAFDLPAIPIRMTLKKPKNPYADE